MLDIVYSRKSFVVYKSGDGFIVHNTKKDFKSGHTHTKSYSFSKRLIDISIKKEIPKDSNKFMLTSLIRLSDDYRFINALCDKI